MSDKLETVKVSEEAARARTKRNIAIGLALALLVVLFYGATMVKLAGNAPDVPGTVVIEQ